MQREESVGVSAPAPAARASKARLLRTVLQGHVGATTVTNVALMGLSLLTGSLAARLLGPVGRGELAAIQLWPLLLATVGSGGLLEAIGYFCAREPDRSRTIVATSISVMLVLALPLMLGGALAMPHLLAAQSAGTARTSQLYLLVVPVLFVVNAAYAALRGRGDLGLWNVLRLTLPAGYAFVLLASALLPTDRVGTVAFGMLGWTTAHVALAIWLIKYRLPGSFHFSREAVQPLARFGGLSMGATAPGWLNARLDQLVIGAFLPPRLLGLYAVGVSWSMAVTPLSNAFSQVILPRLAGSESSEQAVMRLGTTSRLAATTTVMTGALFLLVSPIAVLLLFGPSFAPAIPATLILVVAAVLLGMTQFLEEAVRGLGDPGVAARAELIGLAVTVPALFLLLPRLSILGAAVASMLSYAAILVALSLLLRRRYGLRPGQLFVPRAAEVRAAVMAVRTATLGRGAGAW